MTSPLSVCVPKASRNSDSRSTLILFIALAFSAVLPPNHANADDPEVTGLPEGVLVSTEETLSLTAVVNHTESFALQWLKDGVPVRGQTTSTLQVSNPTKTHAGRYALRVRWSDGSLTTPAVPVVVFRPVSKTLSAEPHQPLRFQAAVWGTDARPTWNDDIREGSGDNLRESWAVNGVRTSVLRVARAEFITIRDVANKITCRVELGETTRDVAVYEVTGKAPRPRLIMSGSGSKFMGLGTSPLCRLYDELEVGIVEYRAKGLPPGVVINASSGYLEGAPTRLGTYNTLFSVLDLSGRVTTLPHQFQVLSLSRIAYPSAKTYSGVISLQSGLPEVTKPFRGFCTLSVSNSGSASGSVTVAGRRQSFRVTLRQSDPDLGNRTHFKELAPAPGLNGMRLSFSQPGDVGNITPIYCILEGQLAEGEDYLGDEGQLYPHLKPDARLQSLLNGRFNARLNIPDPSSHGIDISIGYGWFQLIARRGRSGVVTGVLPDGSSFAASGPLLDTANGTVAFGFYKAWGDHEVQHLHNWSINPGEITPGVGFEATLRWSRSPKSERPVYPDGVRDAEVEVVGGRYYQPTSAQPLLPGLPLAAENADLIMEYGGLEAYPISTTSPADFPFLRMPLTIGISTRLGLPTPAHGITFTRFSINKITGVFLAKALARPPPPLAPISLSLRGLCLPNSGSTLMAGHFLLAEPPNATAPETLRPIYTWKAAIVRLGDPMD